MITISLLKQLENVGIGTIDVDLFDQEVPLDSKSVPVDGMWIVSRSNPVSRFNVGIQTFDIYTRYTNKLEGGKKAKQILDYLKLAFEELCELPSVPPYTDTSYTNVVVRPLSAVNNVGSDEQGKMVFVISGEIIYNVN